jgi:hypothetical protein
MERQTDFPLEKLRELFKKNGSGECKGVRTSCGCALKHMPDNMIPTGLIINEIGVIFCQGETSAERDLLELLQQSEMAKTSAYFFLNYEKGQLSAEGAKILATFEKDPANEDLIAFVQVRVADYKESEEVPPAA